MAKTKPKERRHFRDVFDLTKGPGYFIQNGVLMLSQVAIILVTNGEHPLQWACMGLIGGLSIAEWQKRSNREFDEMHQDMMKSLDRMQWEFEKDDAVQKAIAATEKKVRKEYDW